MGFSHSEVMSTVPIARPTPVSISVVVPAYNEEEVLPEFYRRTADVLRSIGIPYEIVFVNDGSSDRTWCVMNQLRDADSNITLVNLSRNFGKEIALTAGLDESCGEVVIIIDADLQDPPEMIPQFIDGWREGFDVVYAVRTEREGETWLKKKTASIFYRVIQSVSRIKIPKDTGDFRLMSRRSIEALSRLREHHRFMKGLFSWVGFPSKPIHYKREPRAAGQTKWNYWKLWNFALEGITSFTVGPLKMATYIGLAVASLSFLYAAFVIYKTLRYGDPVQGYPSLMVVILFLGGTQLVFTGIIGEYLGRVFNEVKQRPLYLLSELRPSGIKAASLEHHAPAGEARLPATAPLVPQEHQTSR
jgi:glycosyltransferase involved in cell wall biosynthesis